MKCFIITTLSMAFIISLFQTFMLYKLRESYESNMNRIEKRVEALEACKRTRKVKHTDPPRLPPDIEPGRLMAFDETMKTIDEMEQKIKDGIHEME